MRFENKIEHGEHAEYFFGDVLVKCFGDDDFVILTKGSETLEMRVGDWFEDGRISKFDFDHGVIIGTTDKEGYSMPFEEVFDNLDLF